MFTRVDGEQAVVLTHIDRLPGATVVTECTILVFEVPTRDGIGVGVRVTAKTSRGSHLDSEQYAAAVTCVAGELAVHTGEREQFAVMVETILRQFPVQGRVASRAVRGILPLVYIQVTG